MDRFLLCRSEPDKIFTCVLEYDESSSGSGSGSSDKYVRVNDLVYVRRGGGGGGGGGWDLIKSFFFKLEVPPDDVVQWMRDEGFVDVTIERLEWGLVAIMGTKRR